MASFLRQIVAGPRSQHSETGLDLCYVTSNIIATSGPSQTYPQRAYRNPLDRLVSFLDETHGDGWAIWEFRAEGTGYPDEAVHGRIRHYPWPDHHPPPFRLVPLIVAGMRQWLSPEGENKGGGDPDAPSTDRVVVVHCKAGKGRSGTMACSYLIAACGWTVERALERFTERRMRPGFGNGVTIPSQLRWIGYVERWARHGCSGYVDRPVEIVEIHVWGLRHGVKVAVEGFVDEGKKIRTFHTFAGNERLVVEGDAPGGGGLASLVSDMASPVTDEKKTEEAATGAPNKAPARAPTLIALAPGGKSASSAPPPVLGGPQKAPTFAAEDEPGGQAVVFRPKAAVRLPSSDVNIALERRNKATLGLTMVTAVAHVWFNVFFEGHGPEQGGQADDSGVFEIAWDKLDGIKGSSQKGTRAADRIAVVWRVPAGVTAATTEAQPPTNAEVPQMQAADWRGEAVEDPQASKRLGLRKAAPDSAEVSRASSVKSSKSSSNTNVQVQDDLRGVRTSGPAGEELNGVSGNQP